MSPEVGGCIKCCPVYVTFPFPTNPNNILAADYLSLPFRAYLDIRKQFRQVNMSEITFGRTVSAFRMAILPMALRDTLFRFCYETMNHFLVFRTWKQTQSDQYAGKVSPRENMNSQIIYENNLGMNFRINCMITSLLIATTLTMPFDTVATKLITQQERDGKYYAGMRDCFQQAIKTEG